MDVVSAGQHEKAAAHAPGKEAAAHAQGLGFGTNAEMYSARTEHECHGHREDDEQCPECRGQGTQPEGAPVTPCLRSRKWRRFDDVLVFAHTSSQILSVQRM